MKKTLDIFLPCAIIQKLSDGARQRTEYGGIAQLGAQAIQLHTPLLII